MAGRLPDKAVVLRELMPQDLKMKSTVSTKRMPRRSRLISPVSSESPQSTDG